MTLTKEVKPVVTDKHHFDNRDLSFFVSNFWKFWTNEILMQGSISIVFKSNLLLTRVKFSIENLIDERKLVVAEKNDGIFKNFRTMGIVTQDT